MKVDLIVPKTPPAHWNFAFAMDLIGAGFSHPPLSVAVLAALTPSDVDIRIVDENVEEIHWESLSDTVGLSAMFIQRERTFELAARLRAAGKRVLIGGSIVTSLPTQCREACDVVFEGEAELTWPEFISDLRQGATKNHYVASDRFDLSLSVVPRFDLLKMDRYSTASIQTSRGCPYACDYCDVPIIDGRKVRTKTVAVVMAEIEALYALGQRSVFIVDDNFTGNRTFALKVLEAIAAWVASRGYKVIFYCQSTLNIAKDDELLEAMYRANVRRVFLGIESSEASALAGVNKPHNLGLPIVDAVRRIQKWNITVWCALLAGFDDDNAGTYLKYMVFLRNAGIGMVIPGLLQAVPGTAYRERMEASGRLLALQTEYVGGQAGSLDALTVTNVRPNEVALDELVAGYRSFARDVYDYEAYADRVISFLDQGQQPELGAIEFRDAWAVRQILANLFRYYVLNAPADRRRMFTRVVRYAASRRFRRLDEAIFHLVIHKHLFKFYRDVADGTVAVAPDLAMRSA